jgi:hypothetical protein
MDDVGVFMHSMYLLVFLYEAKPKTETLPGNKSFEYHFVSYTTFTLSDLLYDVPIIVFSVKFQIRMLS